MGDTRPIDLSVLTLNGQPLKNPEFQLLPGKFISSFELLQGGPLGTTSLLLFHPAQEDVATLSLVVKAGGETFEVQASGSGKYAPQCPAPATCHQQTFSFTEEKCVDELVPNGTFCGRPDCIGDQLCEEGVCTFVVRENAPPVCGQDVASMTLQPAWTYEADPNHDVAFSGVVDAEDNLYLYDCRATDPGKTRCDIVSVTAAGQRRWQISESALPSLVYAKRLASIAGNLFVSGLENRSMVVQAFRGTDGSLAWERSDIYVPVPAGAGRVAAVVRNTDPMLDGTVLVLDAETGAELSRLTEVIPGLTGSETVSDGNGTLYTSSEAPTEVKDTYSCMESAISLEQGPLWSTNTCNRVRATDGTHVFRQGEQVFDANSQLLYADPGLTADICFNSTEQSIFTTLPGPELARECQGSMLRRLGLHDGVEQSGCHLRENNVPLRILSALLPTREGGTAFLTAAPSISNDATELIALRRTDADGNATLIARLDSFVYHPDVLANIGPVAITNGRWVMSGIVPSGRSAVIAYDVPGLALAEHGWLSPGGSIARSNAPW